MPTVLACRTVASQSRAGVLEKRLDWGWTKFAVELLDNLQGAKLGTVPTRLSRAMQLYSMDPGELDKVG